MNEEILHILVFSHILVIIIEFMLEPDINPHRYYILPWLNKGGYRY